MMLGNKRPIALLLLLAIGAAPSAHGVSQLPSAPQDVFIQVNVLSPGQSAATSTFTAWVDADTPVTTVSMLSEVQDGTWPHLGYPR